MDAEQVKADLRALGSPERAKKSLRFFKTGAGQYGEGDQFLGVTMPEQRIIVKRYRMLAPQEIIKLINSPIHEHRMVGLLILVHKFSKADETSKQAIYESYLDAVYRGRVNNWDLVDASSEFIVGEWLYEKPRDVLFELAASNNLWQRRVAVLASFAFIKHGDPTTTLALAEQLLHDPEDLLQKAVGWMLREIGKRVDRQILLDFLDAHAHEMPRTMLRYAIEHLPADARARYMSRKTHV